jgi:ribosomal protein S18 acetylase RimI-like enzyme
MRIIPRAYAGAADQQRMAELVRLFPADNIHVVDLPYRLSSWAFDYAENIGLWEDQRDLLVGWAVLQSPFWALDYAYRPEAYEHGIHALILEWAEARANSIVSRPNGRPVWYATARSDQIDRIGDLERAGFASQADVPLDPWSQVYLVRSARQPLTPPSLPPGYTLRPLDGAREVDAYVKAHRAAFGSLSMTAEWRARVLQRPEYVPELDLVVVAPGGRLAAFCIGWFAAQGPDGRPTGQIEPLGVHPDFQKLGLGRAILAEALIRLQSHGAEQVVVETDDFRDAAYALYQSAGFQRAHAIGVYRRDCDSA